MNTEIQRLHHVTATVTDARADVEFYTSILGLRLVKKTVNFDNPGVYHFYYGDERGTPSSLMTTFPYRGWGVARGKHGAGQIQVTSFSVPPGSLPAWRNRLSGRGADIIARGERFGDQGLTIEDPSGLWIELIEGAGDSRAPWTGADVPEEIAIRGIHGVTLLLHDLEPSVDLLRGGLGFERVAQEGPLVRMAPGEHAIPGAFIDLRHDPEAPLAVNGLGTVHHVAFEVADDDVQAAFRDRLLDLGRQVTEVRDRQYFRSVYFREPGGVLYELATRGPGMELDEPVDRLGEELRLPAWEEPNRSTIEAQLDVIPPHSS